MDNLAQANAALRSDMMEGFRSLRAAIDALRAEQLHALERLEDKLEHQMESLRKEFSNERRWVIGIVVANILATLGLLAKSMALI